MYFFLWKTKRKNCYLKHKYIDTHGEANENVRKKSENLQKQKKSLLLSPAYYETISRVLKLFYVIFTCSFPKAIMKRSFKSRVNCMGNFIHSAESWKLQEKARIYRNVCFGYFLLFWNGRHPIAVTDTATLYLEKIDISDVSQMPTTCLYKPLAFQNK